MRPKPGVATPVFAAFNENQHIIDVEEERLFTISLQVAMVK